MLSLLRKPWLLIVLILLCIGVFATLNGYRRISSDGVWEGSIVAGIAFILFGVIGSMVSFMSEKQGSTVFTMNVLFVLLNAALFTIHGMWYYRDNYVEKPFEYYNSMFIPNDTATGVYTSVKRSCVMDLKQDTKGQIARISSFDMDEVCDSSSKTCFFTCRIMYLIGEPGDSNKGFLRHYLLDSTFRITSKEELDMSNYSYGDSEKVDSMIRQEVRSTLNMKDKLKLMDSLFPEIDIQEYIDKLDQLEEAAKERGID